MPAPPPDPLAVALPTQRLLSGQESIWAGRNEVERFLDQLNRSSQVASRRVHRWEGRQHDGAMGLSSVLFHGERPDEADAFMGEFRGSFGIEMVGGDLDAAPDVWVIGLPLAGAVTVTTRRDTFTARAGEGVIIDPADVLASRLTPGMHFIEFCLSKRDVARLAGGGFGDFSKGVDPRRPSFAPVLPAHLAQRLMFMAVQAADCLRNAVAPGDAGPASAMMFRRWCEMIALTLLHEQRAEPAPRALAGTAPSAGIKRALAYIHAHADGDIGLADIAEAACMSVSSLLRHFGGQVGLSPYACLKAVRLDRARADLLADAPTLVRDIALRWGFQNASKFSGVYQARFGELPSETRSRGTGG